MLEKLFEIFDLVWNDLSLEEKVYLYDKADTKDTTVDGFILGTLKEVDNLNFRIKQ